MKNAQKNKMTNFQENPSPRGTIDARARYRVAARRLRNTGLDRYNEETNTIQIKYCEQTTLNSTDFSGRKC